METFHLSQDYHEEGLFLEVLQGTSIIEKVAIVLFIFLVVSIILISLWSAILLVSGNTHGGGPLGIIASVIIQILT